MLALLTHRADLPPLCLLPLLCLLPPPVPAVPAEEDLIMLLAATSGEIFKKEVQQYSPLLAAQQPGARLIAARTLHEVFGAKMLPWLIGGETKSAHPLQVVRVGVRCVGAGDSGGRYCLCLSCGC
jgi:hypothetical protein